MVGSLTLKRLMEKRSFYSGVKKRRVMDSGVDEKGDLR